MPEIEQVHFKKGSRVWWDLKMARKKPPWIPARREDQAGEVMDVEGDITVVVLKNSC